MSTNYFEFSSNTRIIAGIDALLQLPSLLKSMGATRIMLISGKVLNSLGVVDRVKGICDDAGVRISAVYIEVPNDGDLNVAVNITNVLTVNNCDAILAVGGGSIIDMAKLVKMMVSQNTIDYKKLYGLNVMPQGRYTPLIVLPTTAGTGSEVSSVAVISHTERQIKIEFLNKEVVPEACILDPSLTLTLPPIATLTSAYDALSHAIEAYTSLQKNEISDAMVYLAVCEFRESLNAVLDNGNDLNARLKMLYIATQSGLAFSNSMVGIGHAIAHAIGAVSGAPHGSLMAILLPVIMRFNKDVASKSYAELLCHFCGEEVYLQTPQADRADKLITSIHTIYMEHATKLGAPINLEQLGVRRDDFALISRKTLHDGAALVNIKKFDKDDVLDILEACYV